MVVGYTDAINFPTAVNVSSAAGGCSDAEVIER
jgi:hypothetical protein